MYCLAACRDASFRSLRRAEIYEKLGDRDKAEDPVSRDDPLRLPSIRVSSSRPGWVSSLPDGARLVAVSSLAGDQPFF